MIVSRILLKLNLVQNLANILLVESFRRENHINHCPVGDALINVALAQWTQLFRQLRHAVFAEAVPARH
jgi:hypothetical protein